VARGAGFGGGDYSLAVTRVAGKTLPVASPGTRLRVGVVLFERFELLDVFGPAEVYGVLPDRFELGLIGPLAGPVSSAQGPQVVAESGYAEAPPPDVVLVPGGIGTRRVVEDRSFLEWLAAWAVPARLVTSVCTGSAVLARAGLLDGQRATSNKRAFDWVVSQGPLVEWVPKARWVVDGDRWTSSGVAAGMDMALAVVAHLFGENLADRVADGIEYDWHRDPAWDPFAAKHGLVVS
jgi:transcriptional regulator GlxA family with amidase domain